MKAWLSSKVTIIFLVPRKPDNATLLLWASDSWIVSVLVMYDMTMGRFFRALSGADVATLTISTRTALSLGAAQAANPTNPDYAWGVLLLGLFLELCQRGHLNAAIRADYARGALAMQACAE